MSSRRRGPSSPRVGHLGETDDAGETETRPEVRVGDFPVRDAARVDVVDEIVGLAGSDRARTAYALHVGGLNAAGDTEFVAAMERADVVYADGGSVLFLARVAGAHDLETAPTTDTGWDIMDALGQRLGRRPRIALLGGPPGLAQRAAEVIDARAWVEVVWVGDGFQTEWLAPLAELRAATPDLVFVGMGAPREMLWCDRHRDQLPPGAVVVTTGGWFGHVTGDEVRAPRLLRRPGLEWIARVAQSPRRLAGRYARGMVTTAAMVPGQLRRRYQE